MAFYGCALANERRVGDRPAALLSGDPGIEGNMARLILNCEGVDLLII